MTSKELTVIERAAVALGTAEHEKALVALVAQSATITLIKNNAGREQCHRALMTIRDARVNLRKVGKDARDDATKFSKAVIVEEDRLVGIISAEEERLQAIRDAWDEAREAEKQAKLQAEARRVAGIRSQIDDIRLSAVQAVGMSVARIEMEIQMRSEQEISLDIFAELAGEAEAARGETLDRLKAIHAATVAQELEAKRVAEERAELARLRAEQEERDRVAAAARAEQERIDRERRDAEEAARRVALDKADAIMRAEREAHETRMAAERAEMQRQQDEAAAEQRRRQKEIDAEQAAARAELQREQDALAAQRRAEADAAAEKRRQEIEAIAQRARDEAARAEAERLEREYKASALQKAAPALLDACMQFVRATESSDSDELEAAYQSAKAAIDEAALLPVPF